MAKKAESWKPTTIRRFVKAFDTSACAALVETDTGPGYLKALGGPEGQHTLACEWVGTGLAKWFGLPTFDFAIVEVMEEDEIPFHKGGKAQPGPAFITRRESGESWSGEAKQLQRLINPEDISRLVVFDTWTLNCDRHSWPETGITGKARVNRNNVFLSEEGPAGQFVLKAIDHTHCFTCGRELSQKLRNVDKIKDRRVFGLFPEFKGYLDRAQVCQAAKDLRRLDRTQVVLMTQSIPKEWDVTRAAMDALVDLIVDRAVYVAETIEERLWPQREFDFGSAAETEQPS